MVNFLSDCVCVCGQSLLQDPGLRRRLLLAISHGGLRPGLDRGAPLDQRNAHQSAVLRRPRNAGSVHVNHRFSFVFCFVWFCFCFFTEKCPNAGASCWAFTSFFFGFFFFNKPTGSFRWWTAAPKDSKATCASSCPEWRPASSARSIFIRRR